VIIVTTIDGINRKADYFRRSLYRAKENGVNIRIIAPITKENLASAKRLAEHAEVRHTDSVIGRYIVVDDKQITFMLVDDDKVHPNYDSGVWVNSPFFAKSVVGMVNSAWQKMTTLKKITGNN
jgi:hypothetical protein